MSLEDIAIPDQDHTVRTSHTHSTDKGSVMSENSVETKTDGSPGPKTPVKKVPNISELPPNVSKSRTLRFHKLFPKTPVEEYPIESFSCAFKGDILLQGQMYVSHNWVCFYSKIRARGRLIEIPFQNIISITREKLALFIPNAIGIQTADQKYVFGSFISRDSTYKKLVTLWKFSQDLASGNLTLGIDPHAHGQSHPNSGPSTESDTTEDDLETNEQLGRLLKSGSGTGSLRRVEVEVLKHSETSPGTLKNSNQQCLNCRHVIKSFSSFALKLQRIPRTNMLLAICSILVFFLMLSAIGLTYKILLLQSKLEVKTLWTPQVSTDYRDRAMSSIYWLQTETHASVIRQLHSVLEANIHLLEEVTVLLNSLHREPVPQTEKLKDEKK